MGISSDRQDFAVDYGSDIEKQIAIIIQNISVITELRQYDARWLAIQMLEGDRSFLETIPSEAQEKLANSIAESKRVLQQIYGHEPDAIIADKRYARIHNIIQDVLVQPPNSNNSLSDRIDRFTTHRVLGLPIFLLIMWVIFKIVTDISAPLVGWVEYLMDGPVTNWSSQLVHLAGFSGTWGESLVIDGIIAGVGGILVFVPVLMALYFVLGVLEDSGYLARSAFVMDRLMNKLGLHGKSFLPMILGFGCSVPAIFATRTLENRKDRILTGLIVPFMSCSARLPVYVLFTTVFFPENAGAVIFGLYLLGILVAILVGLLLRRVLFRSKEITPLVMELPPYRMPTIKGIWYKMWFPTREFISKAWTLILVASIVIWALMAIPMSPTQRFAEVDVSDSAYAQFNKLIAPVFAPLGFGEWETSGAIASGFVAKEVVITTFAQVYGTADETFSEAPQPLLDSLVEIVHEFGNAIADTFKSIPLIININLFEEEDAAVTRLQENIRSHFETMSSGHGRLSALSFMVFILLYTPCIVAIIAVRQELGRRWMFVSIIGQFITAWLFAFIIYQGGLLIGLG